MDCEFAERMEEADDYVEYNPGEREPACPVVPAQQEDSAYEGDQFGHLDRDGIAVSGNELGKVVNESRHSYQNVDAGNDDHDNRPLHK